MQISTPRETESQGLGRNLDSMRILVIEDDRDAASWLIKGLTESGHVTDHAANGEDGVHIIPDDEVRPVHPAVKLAPSKQDTPA